MPTGPLILAIESSCDETAAAVVERCSDGRLHTVSGVVATQHELHTEYGGVVPEIASRAHLERILPVVEECLRRAKDQLGVAPEFAAIAAAHRPGLVGSLLVGVTFAKSLALARGIPFIAVDHVCAHLAAAELDAEPVPLPAIGLVASGGHTSILRLGDSHQMELIGATIDDAAGEAFDKAAAILGLGYPGGPALDALAEGGDPNSLQLPSPKAHRPLDFSFSGLKTALLYAVRGVPGGGQTPLPLSEARRADMAASFRLAVVKAIMQRLGLAVQKFPCTALVAGGGVVANKLLRRELASFAQAQSLKLLIPPLEHCVDNAAMIGAMAHHRLARGESDPWEIGAEPISALRRQD